MEMKDFEVGKKYRNPSWAGKSKLICVGHTTSGVPIMENAVGEVQTIFAWFDWESFVEYREPREFWVFEGFSYTKKENAENYARLRGIVHEVIHVREVIE